MFFCFRGGTAMTLAKAQPCLPRKQNRDSPERGKIENAFFSFSRGTAMTLAKAQLCLSQKEKTENVFFSFPRGTAVTLAKSQPCLSRKKKNRKHVFFVFERHGRDSRESKTMTLVKGKRKENTIFMQFFPQKFRKSGGKPKRQNPQKNHLKSWKCVQKNPEGAPRARHVAGG